MRFKTEKELQDFVQETNDRLEAMSKEIENGIKRGDASYIAKYKSTINNNSP